MIERGVIRHRARRKQIIDMRGLTFGTITPTDIDLVIDFHDEAFAFAELKHRDTKLDYGQKTALVRIVNRIEKSGARAALFVVSHSVDDTSQDIVADRCVVRAIYQRREWHHVDGSPTLRALLDEFLGFGAPVPTHNPMAEVRSEPRVRDGLPTMADPDYARSVHEYLNRSKTGD